MIAFIDDHKDRHGVEPICRVLPIAPSTYYEHQVRQRDPWRRSVRARRDEALKPEIERVWRENFKVYGIRKVWLQLNREGVCVARCTVARLMKTMGMEGVRRGRRVVTTRPDEAIERPPDVVHRNFTVARPNALWVADLTYVATWRGFAYVAFVIDAFARRIVGWRVSGSLSAALALDALEQALYDREISPRSELIHHSDRGVQYLSIRYTERLCEVGIRPSVGRVGDSYDNALAETVIGLFKTEVIRQQGPWKSLEDVEFATLAWVDWFNNKRQFVYLWADGIYTNVRAEERRCILVLVSCDVHGRKHFLAIEDGFRESTESWKALLLSLKGRGLKAARLAVGDGALGFWAALSAVYPETLDQRCWVHKTVNVLDKLPKRLQGPAKSALHVIWQADSRVAADKAFDRFVATYEDKYPKAVDCLVKDRAQLLAFYDFPAPHWQHIRTTNPIESAFATIRLRTRKTRNCVSAKSGLSLMHQLAMSAQKRWRRLRGFRQLADVVAGVKYIDGVDERKISRKAA